MGGYVETSKKSFHSTICIVLGFFCLEKYATTMSMLNNVSIKLP